MYKTIKNKSTSIVLNQSKEGETIEAKIRRVTNNKEPITDGAPLVFTERRDGVRPEFDVRTDRFELAVDATDRISKDHLSKRMERLKPIKGGHESSGAADTGTES